MAELALDRLAKRYGDTGVVQGVTLAVADGEFLSLLGPSGCGKSTILKMIAGLIEPTGGRIRLGGDDITRTPVHRRGLGLVFQSYALFPHLSVFENVAFGLRRQRAAAADIRHRVGEALDLVRMAGYAERLPRQLSGGQQQRVALARAIAPRPRVLLLDEPLSNLDAALRDEMQIELKRLQRDLGVTTVFVTHDQAEALLLSDRICILARGRVQQIAAPEEIYRRPANGFVAGFLGKPNRLAGTVASRDGTGGIVRLGDEGLTIPAARVEGEPGAAADIFIRPEGIVPPGRHGWAPYRAELVLRSFAGPHVQLVFRLGRRTEIVALTPAGSELALRAAEPVGAVSIDPASVFALAPEAGVRT